MNKNLFEISYEERTRIIRMHEGATKKNYLSTSINESDNSLNVLMGNVGDEEEMVQKLNSMLDEECFNILHAMLKSRTYSELLSNNLSSKSNKKIDSIIKEIENMIINQLNITDSRVLGRRIKEQPNLIIAIAQTIIQYNEIKNKQKPSN